MRTMDSKDVALTKGKAQWMYQKMLEIRNFEDRVHELFSQGILPGFVHLYAGEEAVAVGVCAHLTDKDSITSTHRGHGHCLAHGAHLSHDHVSRQEHLNKMMAELAGKETGYSRGRGGSMHIADTANGNLGATGIVAGNIPVATGAALALKMQH